MGCASLLLGFVVLAGAGVTARQEASVNRRGCEVPLKTDAEDRRCGVRSPSSGVSLPEEGDCEGGGRG